MNSQHKKNRITIIVIFALSIIPFGIAWYFAKHPDNLVLGKSNGELLTPPLTTELSDFRGYDPFTEEHLQELRGHWVLINLTPQSNCAEICLEALHKNRQISLMLGKDISRVRTAAALFGQNSQAVFNSEWLADGHLLKIVFNPALQEKIKVKIGTQPTDGMLLIMDPFGNLMMKYAAGYDPYKVKSDLDRLLKFSQIG